MVTALTLAKEELENTQQMNTNNPHYKKHIQDEFESAYMYMHAARGLLFHCCLMHRIQETTIMQ